MEGSLNRAATRACSLGSLMEEKLIIAVNCNKVINRKVTGNKSYPTMPVIRASAKRRLFKDVFASVFNIFYSC